MKRLTIRNSEEVVKVKIKQKFKGYSIYAYEKYKSASKIYTTDTDTPKPFPHEHIIGKGKDLRKLNYYCDNWEITLLNLSEKELTYNLSFEWYQGEDKKPFYTWPEKKEEKEGTIEEGDHVSLRGKCVYI